MEIQCRLGCTSRYVTPAVTEASASVFPRLTPVAQFSQPCLCIPFHYQRIDSLNLDIEMEEITQYFLVRQLWAWYPFRRTGIKINRDNINFIPVFNNAQLDLIANYPYFFVLVESMIISAWVTNNSSNDPFKVSFFLQLSAFFSLRTCTCTLFENTRTEHHQLTHTATRSFKLRMWL